MILHRDKGASRVGTGGLPTSARELGRTLRRIRTRRGLRLEDVSARTGLSLDMLEKLENGAVENVADRVDVLRTLRRFADFLGLPGDRYVLILVDNWPSAAGPSPQIVPLQPAAGTAGTAGGTGPVAVATVAPSPAPQPQAPLDTGTVPAVPAPLATAASATSSTVTASASTASLGRSVVDTGPTPAIRIARRTPETPPPRRSLWTSFTVRAGVVILVAVVVLGSGYVAVHHYEPAWLSDLGITSATHPHKSKTPPPKHTVAPKTTVVESCTPTGSTSATCSVNAPSYVVHVTAVGATSWVQATQNGSVLFSGTVLTGATQQFTVTQPVTLVVGSSAAHVFVYHGSKEIGFYFPQAAPFTLTFVVGTATGTPTSAPAPTG